VFPPAAKNVTAESSYNICNDIKPLTFLPLTAVGSTSMKVDELSLVKQCTKRLQEVNKPHLMAPLKLLNTALLLNTTVRETIKA
jgi:hypothetical protein